MNTSKVRTHYINGCWLSGEGSSLISKNPANGEVVWQGACASKDEVILACDAAREALASWSLQDFATRAHYLHRFAEQITAKTQELTHLIAVETGKPLWEAMTEVSSVINKVALSIQAYQERNAEKHQEQASLRFKPHGVVAILGPFNFPAHLSNGHIVPALLAGNTVVLKPSELAPAVAQLIMQCWHDSGLPRGVINCIQGDSNSGNLLLGADIQGVYFTGSYATGKQIHQQFAGRPEVILALEMGGNNPLIIDDINNLNAAIYQTVLSTLSTAGQRCTCARRLFIPSTPMGNRFLHQLIETFKTIKVSSFTQTPEPFMGPVISYEHAVAHLQAQQALIQMGGNPLLLMSLLSEKTGLLTPGMIDMSDVNNPPDEEIFAPFVQIYRYQEFEQALALANQTRYGLVAGLFSDNPTRYQQFYQTIRAGLINWNRPTTGALSSLPFGGIGWSGNHRPSAYFAADYCAYPVASLEQTALTMPEKLLPGINLT